jgi:hypothetical protein
MKNYRNEKSSLNIMLSQAMSAVFRRMKSGSNHEFNDGEWMLAGMWLKLNRGILENQSAEAAFQLKQLSDFFDDDTNYKMGTNPDRFVRFIDQKGRRCAIGVGAEFDPKARRLMMPDSSVPVDPKIEKIYLIECSHEPMSHST